MIKYALQSQVAIFNRLATGTPTSVTDFKVSVKFALQRREENQLDATERFVAIIICSTCFGHLHAYHQELETILVLLPHMVMPWLLVVGC